MTAAPHDANSILAYAAVGGRAFSIRQAIGKGEADLYLRILEGLAFFPLFHIIVIADLDENTIRRLRITLQSLWAQPYDNWRLRVIFRDPDKPLDDLREDLVAGEPGLRTLRCGSWKSADTTRLREQLLSGFDEVSQRVGVLFQYSAEGLTSLLTRDPGTARPEFVTILEAEDRVAANGLLEFALTAGMAQNADLFYSGEPRIRPGTNATGPVPQPGWSPVILPSTNVVGQLWFATLRVIEATGVTIAELLHLGEYEVVLRCTEQASAVVHVPLMLCERGNSWRDGNEMEQQALVRAEIRRGSSRANGAQANEKPPEASRGGSPHAPFVAATSEPVEVIYAGRPLFPREWVRNILVVKLDHIGDCITSFPAIRRLKRHFPQARVSVLAGHWSKPIWSLIPEVAEVIVFDFFDERPGAPPPSPLHDALLELRERLEPRRFDLAIDLRRQGDTRHVLKFTGARYLAGFEHAMRFPWLDIALEWEGERRIPKRQPVSMDLINLADAIAAESEPPLVLELAPPNQAAGPNSSGFDTSPDKRLICVHPGAFTAMKRWPARRFAELIDLLLQEKDIEVVLTGGNSDRAAATTILENVQNPDRVRNLAGELPLAQFPALLKRCSLFIGNDSGPKHLAASLGIPTVGVHSGTHDAMEWGPQGVYAAAVRRRMVCSPCFFTRPEECTRNLACLTELPAVDVYAVCRRFLAITPVSPRSARV